MLHDEAAHYLMAPQDITDHLSNHHGGVGPVLAKFASTQDEAGLLAWAVKLSEQWGIDTEDLSSTETIHQVLHELDHGRPA